MQVSTGAVFATYQTAVASGVPTSDLVEVRGTREQVEALSAAVQRARRDEEKVRSRRAQQKASRRANRR